MKKKFNDTGVCIPSRHYMVDISTKIDQILDLIEAGSYFTINRPRQFGKTTTLNLLTQALKKYDDYQVFRLSFEGFGDVAYESVLKINRFMRCGCREVQNK